jgi:isopentenyl-diphosphate delta-isomerase
MEQQVILVNEKDEQTGTMEKTAAHQQGLLHRAFSIFIFNNKGEMLLQQRAVHKYHSAALWSNACCSHPNPGESTIDAAHRRLREELGFDTKLEKAFDFIYKADVGNGLTEHELDHVFFGKYDGELKLNHDEVAAVGYRSIDSIKEQLERSPEKFTSWFRLLLPKVLTHRDPSA